MVHLRTEPMSGVSESDFARCHEILRAGSQSFYAAGMLLPRRLRGPIAALYAFCRVADDAVDLTAPGGRAAAIARLAARVDAVYADAPHEGPVDRAFAAVVRARGIPRALPDALVEGFRWDVEGRRYDTFDDLCAYAARVAATVGVMMTLILGERRPRALARACDLGVAMQLTNIARDVGEDARDGRVYLPTRWLADARVPVEDLTREPRFTPALGTIVRRLLVRANALYVRADDGLALLAPDVRVAMTAARFVYADIGRVIARSGYDSVSRRAATSQRRKLALLALAPLRSALPRAVSRAAPLPAAQFLVDAVSAHDTRGDARTRPDA